MNRATTSLPVHDSPSRQVVDSVPATRAARFITPSHAGDVPNAPAAAPLLSIDDVLPRSACTDRSFHEHCEDVV
jgi:hypothetical protein